MPPDIFTHIEGFEFRELLGQGGFGSVCKAIDRLGREVAIKALTLTGEEGPQRDASNRAFLREAKTLAQLNHPNIVTIYSFDIDSSDRPYLVMEFLPGEPLSRIIRSGRQLHLVEKLSIILQAAKALQFAHNAPHPVVHRDIKPHNLMVMRDLTVKLIDFGIAQVGGIGTQSMNIVGSLPYMSPEHWQPPLTPWCDVFSLGVVLFELLTGTVPFATEADTAPAACQKMANDKPAPLLKEFLSDVPAGLEDVVARVLNKDKTRGYADAQQFWLDLSLIYNAIKPQFLQEGLERATAAKNAGDYATASELVQRLLTIDRENRDAGVLQAEINQAFQRNDQGLKVRTICDRVEEALLSKKFDLAQLGLDEALQLEPGSEKVALLNQRLQLARGMYAKIEKLIADAEKHKQSGHWEGAAELVAEALDLDRTNTLALNLRADIERRMAAEHKLCVDARSALENLQFQEAFQFIRKAEALAPESEHVKALKEYAVSVYQQQTDRKEAGSVVQNVQRLIEANKLAEARIELQLALTRYPEHQKLLRLRDTVELKLAASQRDQFVQEQCIAAEQENATGNPGASLTRAEEALSRFPDDPGLQNAAEKAKRSLAIQAADKRKKQYLEQVYESLRIGNGAQAIVTLEMTLDEFEDDGELQALLVQARAMFAGNSSSANRDGEAPRAIPEQPLAPVSATVWIAGASKPQPPQASSLEDLAEEENRAAATVAEKSQPKNIRIYKLTGLSSIAVLLVGAMILWLAGRKSSDSTALPPTSQGTQAQSQQAKPPNSPPATSPVQTGSPVTGTTQQVPIGGSQQNTSSSSGQPVKPAVVEGPENGKNTPPEQPKPAAIPGVATVEKGISKIAPISPQPSQDVAPSLTPGTSTAFPSLPADKRIVALAPPVPASTPVTAPPSSESKFLKDMIEVHYKDAYESMDIDRVKKMWWHMPKEAKKSFSEAFNGQFQAIKINFRCAEPMINGDSAQPSCSQSVVVTRNGKQQREQTARVTFKLRKIDGAWLIEDFVLR